MRAPQRDFDALQRLRISARRFVLGLVAGAAAALALYFLSMLPTGIAAAVLIAAIALTRLSRHLRHSVEAPAPFPLPRSNEDVDGLLGHQYPRGGTGEAGRRLPMLQRIRWLLPLLAVLAGAVAVVALGLFASSGPQPDSFPSNTTEHRPDSGGQEHSGSNGSVSPGSGSRPSVADPSSDSGSFVVEILASGAIALALFAVVFAATALIPRLTQLRRIRGAAARTLPVEPEELSDEDLVKSLTTVLATAELTPSERIQLVEARVRLARATPVQGDEHRLPYWVAFGSPVVGMTTGVAGVLIALAQ